MAGAHKNGRRREKRQVDKYKRLFQFGCGAIVAIMAIVDASPLTKGETIPIEIYLLVISVMIGIRPEGLLNRK